MRCHRCFRAICPPRVHPLRFVECLEIVRHALGATPQTCLPYHLTVGDRLMRGFSLSQHAVLTPAARAAPLPLENQRPVTRIKSFANSACATRYMCVFITSPTRSCFLCDLACHWRKSTNWYFLGDPTAMHASNSKISIR